MRWFQSFRTQTGVLGQATPVVLRSFPHPSSPEAPSLHRNYSASPVLRASPPPRRSRLTLTGSRLTRATPPAGLPVLLPPPSCPHASHYPGETDRCSRRSLPGRWQPSPFLRRVGFRIARFEACSAFAHAVACGLAESPKATLWHRSASVHIVASMNRSDCYRLERQCPLPTYCTGHISLGLVSFMFLLVKRSPDTCRRA